MKDPHSGIRLNAKKFEVVSMSLEIDPPKRVKPKECKWIYKPTQMKMFISIKFDLLQTVFDKFKELTATRLSRYSDAQVSSDYFSNCCIFQLSE